MLFLFLLVVFNLIFSLHYDEGVDEDRYRAGVLLELEVGLRNAGISIVYIF